MISSGGVLAPIDRDLTAAEQARLLAHSESAVAFVADRLAGGVAAAEFPISLPHPRDLLCDELVRVRRDIVAALRAAG